MHQTRKPRVAVFDFSESPDQSGMGRVLAFQFAEHLLTSPYYAVLTHHAWRNAPRGGAVNQGCRFSRAWAVNAGALVSADAVVLGNIHHSRDNGNLTLQAAMVDTTNGEIVVKTESTSLRRLVSVFDSRHVAGKILLNSREIRGVIVGLCGEISILNAGNESGLREGDRLRVERVLRKVPDPFYAHSRTLLGYVTATIGRAQVLEVGKCASLIQVCGSPRVGDWGIQSGS